METTGKRVETCEKRMGNGWKRVETGEGVVAKRVETGGKVEIMDIMEKEIK